jgi:hypothetical protein
MSPITGRAMARRQTHGPTRHGPKFKRTGPAQNSNNTNFFWLEPDGANIHLYPSEPFKCKKKTRVFIFFSTVLDVRPASEVPSPNKWRPACMRMHALFLFSIFLSPPPQRTACHYSLHAPASCPLSTSSPLPTSSLA